MNTKYQVIAGRLHAASIIFASMIVVALSAASAHAADRIKELACLGGSTNAAAVAPNAIIINEEYRIVLLDPANPSRVLGYEFASNSVPIHQILYSSGYAYTLNEDFLTIFDIRDVNRPHLAIEIPVTDGGHSIRIDGDRLYLMTYASTLLVYDIELHQGNPLFLGIVGGVDFQNIWFVKVRQNLLFVGRQDRVDIYDVADFSNVGFVGTLAHGVNARDMDFDGNVAAVVGNGKLSAWDISNPSSPVLIDNTNVPVATHVVYGNGAWFIDAETQIVQEWLLVSGVWTIATQIDGGISNPEVRDYHYSDGRIYVAATWRGLRVVDVTQLNAIHVSHVFNSPNNLSDVIVHNNVLFATDRGEGLQAYDFTDPAHMIWLGEYSTPVWFNAIDIENSIATVASTHGLLTIDVSDPTNMQMLDSYGAYSFSDVAVRGNYAYATETDFRVLNITDPGNIVSEGTFLEGTRPRQVEIVDDYAYVTSEIDNLTIYDISMPPFLLSVNQISGIISDNTSPNFQIKYPFMHVVEPNNSNLIIYDISDLSDPKAIGESIFRNRQAAFVGPYMLGTGRAQLSNAIGDFYDVIGLVDLRLGGITDFEYGLLTEMSGYSSMFVGKYVTLADNVVCAFSTRGFLFYATDAFDFTFERNPDVWPWQPANAVPALSSPDFARAGGALQITATDNATNFGWWQMPGGVIPVVPGQVARVEWTVSSDQTDAAMVPSFRMRASRGNFQQFDILTINASGAADLAPAPGPRTFTQIVDSQPGASGDGADSLALAFDLIGFDPARSPSATLGLEQVVIDSFALSALPAPQPIASWDFDAGVEGWSLITAGPFPPASGDWQSGALRLQSSEFLSFGSWVSPFSAASIQPGDLVRARFNIAAMTTAKSVLPTFRARFLSNDAQFAIEKGFNSAGDGALGPSLQGDNYDIYAIAPVEMNGGASVPVTFGFDLLHFDPADQAFAGLDLLSVRLDRFQPIPLLAPDGEARGKN